jgi:pimeloyl-ACP methyl ester carboxylesterase
MALACAWLALAAAPSTPAQSPDVAEGRMHLRVSGSGSPVVVLEAGYGSDHRAWQSVHDRLAAATTVVSYDRRGLGKSPPSEQPRTGAVIAKELHAALARAGVAPPYVLVGHSYGGLLVRVFAAAYPTEVVGLVLVDPAPDGFYARAARERPREYLAQLESDLVWSDRHASAGANREGLAYEATVLQSALARLPSGLAVALISAERSDLDPALHAIWRDEHATWARANGARLLSVDAGHDVPREQPELVARAITDVVAAAAAAPAARSQQGDAGN